MTFFATSGVKPGKTRRSAVLSSGGHVSNDGRHDGLGDGYPSPRRLRPAASDAEAGVSEVDIPPLEVAELPYPHPRLREDAER